MTTVTINMQDLMEDTGPTPATGYFVVGLFAPILDDPLTTTKPFTVYVSSGTEEFTVPPTPANNAYLIKPHLFEGLTPWYVQIPDIESITLAELIQNHQVDPATFEPVAPGSTVQTQLDDLDERVTELERIVPDAEATNLPVFPLGESPPPPEEEELGHTYGITGRWQFSASIGGVPGGAQFTLSHGTAADAVWVRFAKLDKANIDFTTVLMSQKIGQTFLVQGMMNATNWAESIITGPSIDGGSYVEVSADAIQTGGFLGGAAWQECIAFLSLTTKPA